MTGRETLYYGMPAAIYQTGRDSFLVHHRSLAKETVEIDGFTASILAACTGLKTLEGHGAACLLAGVSPDPQAIAASLVHLVTLGLIRANPDGELPAASLTLDKSVAVAIVTADRRSILDRCLKSLTSHLKDVGRNARIVVVDGSQTSSNETQTVVNAVAGRYGKTIGSISAVRGRHKARSQTQVPHTRLRAVG